MSTVLDSVASWTAPIQGASPTGTPARGDDDYEKLRAEIAKLSAADGAGPSWSDVYTLATEILTRKSKDLMVASYLCAALVDRDGARGLQAGLQLYKNLCTDYWPQLFPEIERVRGRVSAIAWLSEQAAKNLARTSPGAGDAEPLLAAQKLLDELDTLLAEKLSDQTPGVGSLKDALRTALGAAQDAAPKPAATTATAAGASSAAAAAGPGEIASDADVKSALEAARDNLRNVAAYRRRANLADASSYRYQRIAEWLLIERIPPATDGKTLVQPPTDLKSRIEALVQASNWAVLIEQCERSMRGDNLFWLDLHWQVSQALKALGPTHDEARKAVAQELGRVLARFPGLEQLKFQNGTPFADGKTLAWIDAECRTSPGGAPRMQPLVAPEGTERDALAEVTKELESAQALAADGNLSKALGHLQARQRAAESRREKFLWRVASARLLVYLDRPDVARPQLEGLDEELGRVPVSDWDLAVVVDVVRALLECQRKLIQKQGKATPDMADRMRALYERLARLDPAAAIGAGSAV
ncbi:MAG TPA: type VI secretion system protein TssA [Polyangia bacterium]|nr:type VI secretion system protein TssA [Polyangia bacterium]